MNSRQANNLALAIAISAIFFCGFFSHKYLSPKSPEGAELRDTLIVTQFVQRPPVTLTDAPAKIVYKNRIQRVPGDSLRDTVYVDLGDAEYATFTASLDTLIKSDTLSLKYDWPQNIFSVWLRSAPDSVKTYQITVTKFIDKKTPWWQTALIGLGSAGVGFAAGSLIH